MGFFKLDEKQFDERIAEHKQTIKRNIITLIILIPIFSILVYANLNKSFTENESHNDLLQSLQNSALIYVAQQRVPPEKFSDFVTSTDKVQGAKVLSLSCFKENLDQKTPVIIPDSNEMQITFKARDGKRVATYYLNGTDITAKFELLRK